MDKEISLRPGVEIAALNELVVTHNAIYSFAWHRVSKLQQHVKSDGPTSSYTVVGLYRLEQCPW